MPETPLTPEEKLLRIIESPQGASRSVPSRRSLQDYKFFFKSWQEKSKGAAGEKIGKVLNLKAVNVILAGIATAATIFLVVDFVIGMPRSLMVMSLEAAAKKKDVGNLTIEGLEPLTIYLQEIKQRNVFALTAALQSAAGAGAGAAAQTTSSPTEKPSFTSTLKVVGILWSDTPQAIIEDSKENKTYLLNRGSKIKEARVKEILKDRVILSYDNQEIELQ